MFKFGKYIFRQHIVWKGKSILQFNLFVGRTIDIRIMISISDKDNYK